MPQADFDVQIERAVGSMAFIRAQRESRTVAQDPAALRSLLAQVDCRRRMLGRTRSAMSEVQLDIACAVLDAHIETLDEGEPAETPPERIDALVVALTYLVQARERRGAGPALVRWALGEGLQGVAEAV